MIKFTDISKTFIVKKQEIHALQHISLEIQDGDIFGVIGFSGAGKSTLLRMVNALESPTEGTVEINGRDINKLSFNELRKVRKDIGMIFQQFNLLESKTVYDNIAIPLVLKRMNKADIEKRVSQLLDFVELADKRNAYPAQLSGGQKQRVGIARALSTDPSILLCDEATSALDPETTDSILRLLEKINKTLNITILVVTHEINVIQHLCNQVAVMERGHIVETGSVLDVFSNPQQNITKRFVRNVLPDTIPASVAAKLKEDTRHYKIIKLRFLGDNVEENILYYINKHFSAETNMLFASVNELQKTVVGIFILQIIGDNTEFDKITAYISEHNIQWQEVTL
ncbi:methionine ABC transporter ATP-binding protein [Pectinatus cerevisiiphilus]|uniref:D-methionine transport system ATP-binding protein n=1 Tax=Pectinatus cerevisiiphilus TaxID=86956 RepID=A0A4R3KFK2_9FIRM|nr:ATP-binding cassette domain-containing protein [Pectinatus cerevisiiphilus]TCS81833.1 D-methionine transport system ATP-binding protein [Pectinatus cerevisiiphilus]